MPNVNQCTIAGHLGQDPDLKYTSTGLAVCNLSIATSSGKPDNRRTTWHRVVVWKELAEEVSEHFKKGDAIEVRGPYESDTWQDKDGNDRISMKLTAFSVSRPIYAKKNGDAQPQQRTQQQASKPQASTGQQQQPEGDIPF